MYKRNGIEVRNGWLGGCCTAALAEEYGTPLYVMDEEYIRGVCGEYTSALKEYGDGLICYASKAFSCKEIYRIVNDEGMGTDVVSGGELLTAAAAGMPMDKVYFHGNNKTGAELLLAIKHKVRAVVVDSLSEIDFLQGIAAKQGAKVNALIRLNPGIAAHTHSFVQTATVDSKFGCPVSDGTAFRAAEKIAASKNLKLIGLHSHIGSQIFELEPYMLLADCFVKLALEIRDKLKIEIAEFNMGGGFGVRYTDEGAPCGFGESVKYIAEKVKEKTAKAGLKKPFLVFEPGRSIVAEAGKTLYTVGAVKENGGKKYVAVDGGIFENPRYALYQSKYSACLVKKANVPATEKVTIAGKCCESGDIIIGETLLPKAERGDILEVFGTGAYNFSMASNYNRNPVPSVVMVKDGKSRVIVKGQAYGDIMARDV